MEFICPHCRGSLRIVSERELYCPRDGFTFQQVDGIWRFLSPNRELYYARFISDYEAVRRFEGRYSTDSSYYRSLPFKDITGRFSTDWKIRAASYRVLEKMIEPAMQVVDLGAGNGWLSNRLAGYCAQVYAVDLLVNEEDGLGTWKQYENKFTSVQAEFLSLPFTDDFASLVVFNASFHYSENYEEALTESLRILQPGGKIIIMDSPVYHLAESGEIMVVERKAGFLSRYGFASDALQSESYLTYARMQTLGEKLNIRWRHIRPCYGLYWQMRPWLARIRGLREPAEFGLWVGLKSETKSH